MIKINLFPYRAAKVKENIRRQVTIYFLSVIFLILAMTYLFINFNKEIKSLKQRYAARQRELATFKDTNAKINALKKNIAELKVKLETINELERAKTGPVKLLDDLSMSVPKDKLWLTNIAEKKGTLSLTGTAMDNETVADFMKRLDGKKTITSVKLIKTKRKMIKDLGLNLKDFDIKCKTYAFKEKSSANVKGKRKK
ncbi:MAG: PilN domain-containing protein [Thermodesulfobacteriota bacterium]|nr:PilN domain-containing protein [Thermodesulfobacteriota bacterium]